MDARDHESALRARSLIERGEMPPARFASTVRAVAATERDAWLNVVLGLDEIPDDGPELPRDCVPYLPCSVDSSTSGRESAARRRSFIS
jgi:hypothetical protein